MDNQKGNIFLSEYPPLLTVKQVAEIFQVTPLTIKRWGKKGILPPIRINSRGDRRYTKEQVFWLLGQRQDNQIEPSVNKKLYEVEEEESKLMTGNSESHPEHSPATADPQSINEDQSEIIDLEIENQNQGTEFPEENRSLESEQETPPSPIPSPPKPRHSF